MTEQASPLVTVKCPTPACSEYNVEKDVSLGAVVGDNVILTGNLACMVCGSVTEPVHGD